MARRAAARRRLLVLPLRLILLVPPWCGAGAWGCPVWQLVAFVAAQAGARVDLAALAGGVRVAEAVALLDLLGARLDILVLLAEGGAGQRGALGAGRRSVRAGAAPQPKRFAPNSTTCIGLTFCMQSDSRKHFTSSRSRPLHDLDILTGSRAGDHGQLTE